MPRQLGEDLADAVGARPRTGRRRGSGRPGWAAATVSASRMSVLPISRNTPPRGSSRSDASTNSPASESSTTSTPRPPVTARNFCSKSRRARVADVVVVEAHGPQRVPLAPARGGEHLETPVPGQLHRGHADAAGARRGSAPTGRAARRPARAVRRTRSRSTTVKPAACGVPTSPSGIGSDERGRRWSTTRAGALGEQPHHAVADGDSPVTPGPTSVTTPAASLPMQRVAGIHAEGDHDVAEVGGDGAHRRPGCGRARSGSSASGISSSARLSNVPAVARPPVATARRRAAASAAPSAARLRHHARDVRDAVADDHLRFADGDEHRGERRSASRPSVSTSTMRPGCSVCAARTRPHTAAPARSVTSSPGSATAPRVTTSSDAGDGLGQPGLQPRERRVGGARSTPRRDRRNRLPRGTDSKHLDVGVGVGAARVGGDR